MRTELLEILQFYVQNKSVDELKNTKPNELMRELGILDSEFLAVIDFLHNKGAMLHKFNILCPSCGINHTIYETEIQKNEKRCDECGEVIEFQSVLRKSSALYLLDKKEILSLCKSKHVDFNTESLKKIIKIDDKRKQRPAVIDEIMNIAGDKVEIFIGSSKEAASEIEQIALVIEEKGFKALPWNSAGKGVFVPTHYTLENLINVSKRVIAAIFIFNSDDEIWYTSENTKQGITRDNVLFEYGLFVGQIGPNKVVFICKNHPKIASDLQGITYIDAEKEFHMKAALKDWLNTLK